VSHIQDYFTKNFFDPLTSGKKKPMNVYYMIKTKKQNNLETLTSCKNLSKTILQIFLHTFHQFYPAKNDFFTPRKKTQNPPVLDKLRCPHTTVQFPAGSQIRLRSQQHQLPATMQYTPEG